MEQMGGLAGPSSDTTGSVNPQIKSRFGETDDNGQRTTAQEERLEAYRRIAAERCERASAAARARAEEKLAMRRPKHVWWGFHYFWPPEVLNGTDELDPMDDVNFLQRVQALMQHERVVETFSIFDVDSSGTIDAKELRPVVTMVAPNLNEDAIAEMVASLDLNKDGEVDLWEFCVAIQRRTEGISVEDMRMELDEAFNQFDGNDDQEISEQEIRAVMTNPHTKHPLTEKEFQDMLTDLDQHGMSVRNGARIPKSLFRTHPAFK